MALNFRKVGLGDLGPLGDDLGQNPVQARFYELFGGDGQNLLPAVLSAHACPTFHATSSNRFGQRAGSLGDEYVSVSKIAESAWDFALEMYASAW